jgi:LCP family protein required for cell wall assembly
MVGSDSRAFAKTAQDRKQFGAAQQGDGQRSDTMMVVRIDPKTNRTMILSIARDLYVKIDGGGMDRINAAFADPKNPIKSDPGRLIRTIKANFGIPVNHYVEVDFEGFRDVVNAIGGVPIYFKYPARDAFSLLDVRQPGCVQLDGSQALAYVRARHLELKTAKGWETDGSSDIGRIQRQQDFIRRVLHKATHEGLTNPVTAVRLINAGASHLTTDSGFGVNDMRRLAGQLRGISDTGLTTQALTGAPFTAPGGADVLRIDRAGSAPLIAQFGGPAAAPPRRQAGPSIPATTAAPPPPAPPGGGDPSTLC